MKKAYTLVEMVLVIVIIGIVAGIAVPLMLEVGDAWSLSSKAYDRAALQAVVITGRMSKEIRQLRDARSLVTATNSQLTFFNTNNTNITYSSSGSLLMRNNDVLAENIGSFSFTYYNDTNATIVTPVVGLGNVTDVRRVEVNYSLSAGSRPLHFTFAARLYNVRGLNELFKQD